MTSLKWLSLNVRPDDSCLFLPFSDGTVVRKHGERDHAHGLRERASGGGAESELQQPRQSRGVPADCRNAVMMQRVHRWPLFTSCVGFFSREFQVETRVRLQELLQRQPRRARLPPRPWAVSECPRAPAPRPAQKEVSGQYR